MSAPKVPTKITQQLAKVAGQPVEITVRGVTEFTWSIEKPDPDAAERLAAYARQDKRVTTSIHTDETGSYVYLTIDLSDEKLP